MRLLNILGILFLVLLMNFGVLAQDVDYTEKVMVGDSVVLALDNYVGDIQWQKSDDFSNWGDISGEDEDELLIIAVSSTYYRTIVSVSGCDPYVSQTVYVEVDDGSIGLNLESFTGLYNCDEPGYYPYLCNFTLSSVVNRIINDNFWNYDLEVEYEFFDDGSVQLIDKSFVADLGRGSETFIISSDSPGTYDQSDYSFVVPYKVYAEVDNALIESKEHVFSNLSIVQSPFAGFSIDQTSTFETGGLVKFIDRSTNNPTSWLWTFGDGSTSTLQNPTYTYSVAGTYTVSLTVSNSYGSDTETKTDYITITNNSSTDIYYMDNTTITTCAGTFYDAQGTSDYVNDEDYTMTFYPGTSGKVLQFYFSTFDLESNTDCSYDYLEIYDGNSTSASLIGKYCGTNSPETITATNESGALTFVFHSDGSQTYSGWEASISCIDGNSSSYYMDNTTITTCAGTFYDAQGTSNYINDEDYTMTFYPGTSGKVLQFYFSTFDLESNTDCSYDYLEIYDGNSTSASLIGKYCGTNSPETVTATNESGALTFVFHSDGSQTYSGWEASLSCVDGNNSSTVTDYDGNVYQTVQIGNQIWMAENLKTTHYADGTIITLVESGTTWSNLTTTDKAMCYYNNNANNEVDTYGALYTWAAAINTTSGSSANPSGVQGACPDGWHLPSDEEWKQVEMYLGMSQSDADNESSWRGTNEGSKLAGNEALWCDGTLDNNTSFGSSGFEILPGGYRSSSGPYLDLGFMALFWTSTENEPYGQAWSRSMSYNQSNIYRSYYIKEFGRSIRCVKD